MHRAIVVKPRRRPTPVGGPSWPQAGDPFGRDQFLFNPRLLSFGYEYAIDDDFGQTLMLAVKRVFSLVLHVDVFADESCTQPVLSIRQDSPWQLFYNEYTVYDGLGQAIGAIRRDPMLGAVLWSAYRRSRFSVTDASLQVVASAEPEFDLMALNWQINGANGGMLGRWIRRLALTDKHTLDLSVDIMRSFDRRLAVALGVLLDFACRR